MDYVYCYLSYFGYKAGEETMMGFWREMDRLGKDKNPYRAGFLQFVGVAGTREEAYRLYKEPAEYFYGRCLHVNPMWASPPGYQSEATIRARITSQVAQAAAAARSGPVPAIRTWDEIVDAGYVIIGSPDEVASKVKEVATNLNVGQLMLLCQFGNMSTELARYNTRMYAEKVMPQVRDLFDDQWENRWWPKPMSNQSVPREVA
jgi:alkanesulfonate monooxygenase SsuD/methylene tetrahydromethanopterin reductase-like flavin-dependent oxidoreductase (luciferase family)